MHTRICLAAAVLTFSLLAGFAQPSASQPSKSPFGPSVGTAKKTPASTPTKSPAPQPTSPTAQPAATQSGLQQADQQPAAPSQAATAACQTVTACFREIAARHPQAAVDEYFDPSTFSRRVMGSSYDRLDAAQQRYVEQLSSVMFKSLVSGAAFSAALVAGQNPQLSASEQNGDVLVSFVTSAPSDGQRRNTLLLHESSDGWRIIDVNSVAQRTTDFFRQQQADPSAMTLGMEGLVGGVIYSKAARTDDSSQRAESKREAQAGNIRAQLKALTNQIELFKARNGSYPDLAAHGWDDLIKGGYISAAPVNPVNQSSKICIGLHGKPGYGWSWNASTGELGATYFDEQTLALTPDSP